MKPSLKPQDIEFEQTIDEVKVVKLKSGQVFAWHIDRDRYEPANLSEVVIIHVMGEAAIHHQMFRIKGGFALSRHRLEICSDLLWRVNSIDPKTGDQTRGSAASYSRHSAQQWADQKAKSDPSCIYWVHPERST